MSEAVTASPDTASAPRANSHNRAGWVLARPGYRLVLAVFCLMAAALPIALTEPVAWFDAADLVLIRGAALLMFALDGALNLARAALDERPGAPPARMRVMTYLRSGSGYVDLLSIAAMALPLATPRFPDLYLVLSCVPVVKLLRFFAALEIMAAVLKREGRPLMTGLLFLLILLLFIAVLAYLLERDAQPKTFGSVAAATWWGITALSSVGYGDAIPVTPLGKLLGGVAVIIGIGMFALPTGILATGFAEELRRRNFVVTWNLVAGVPFFSALPALVIAELADKLEPMVANKGELVIHQGDQGDAMFFLIEGEVDTLIDGRRLKRLHSGEYFGEMALLAKTVRSASVQAATFCRLLRLRDDTLQEMLEVNPQLRTVMAETARERLGIAQAFAGRNAAQAVK